GGTAFRESWSFGGKCRQSPRLLIAAKLRQTCQDDDENFPGHIPGQVRWPGNGSVFPHPADPALPRHSSNIPSRRGLSRLDHRQEGANACIVSRQRRRSSSPSTRLTRLKPATFSASVPPSCLSTRAITPTTVPPASRTARMARSAEVPEVTTSSMITARSPFLNGPSMRLRVPCCLGSLRTVNARSCGGLETLA